MNKCKEIEQKIAILRAAATKEKQLARRVEMNIELQRLQRELETSTRQLSHSG